jgi:hypothetical protein
VLCDFTNDSERLQKILAEYGAMPAVKGDDVEPLPSGLPSAEMNAASDASNQHLEAFVNATRAGVTIKALREIADHVAGIPGRKSLIWLTASMPFNGETVARVVSRANLAVYPVDARGLATSYNSHFVGRGSGIPQGADLTSGQIEMREVADETGGRAYLNNNDLSGAIRKAIDDAAVTYTLGFYVDAKSLDGKFHEIKVRVKNPGMEVHYPRGYYALAEKTAENNVDRIVLSPLEAEEVHLLARVERVAAPASLSVSGSIDLKNIEMRTVGTMLAGSVELYLVQQDPAGEVLDKSREKMVLRLTQEEYASYLKTGLFFRKVIPAKHNVATLRVVAGDPRTAKMGSLIIPVAQVH